MKGNISHRKRFATLCFVLFVSMITSFNALGTGINEEVITKDALTVVIDAGHGGEDGGAVSLSGMRESAINLNVAQRLELILAFYGVHVSMTRTDEKINYSASADTIREKKAEDQKKRLQLINATENAVLISIHQNYYPDGGPFGAQVLYAPTEGSKELAEQLQLRLISALNTKNRRTASRIPDSILLFNNIKCPAILIECGFLSNSVEEKLLKSDVYRLKLAAVIASGFLYFIDNLDKSSTGELYESKNSFLLH